MAVLFAIFGCSRRVGTGNLVQVNSIAEAVNNVWDVNPWITGIILAVVTGLVIIGGVKRIGQCCLESSCRLWLFYILQEDF